MAANENSSNVKKWHGRFGHLGLAGIRELIKGKMVNGMPLKEVRDGAICEPCVEAKMERKPFPKQSSRRAKGLLDVVHSDVCGKMGEPSLSGGNYFLTLIDDKSRYVWVYILKQKGEVAAVFSHWRSLVEKESGRKVKTLRSDNGGEYISHDFETYLKSNGIKHEYIVPKNPEQNGVAERLNRTLVEAVRAMMMDGNFPKRFWAELVTTAAYLKNRWPTKALASKTPYETWTGNRPDVSHLRRIGSSTFHHIPSDERRKLDAKAKKSVMLGYSDNVKGYRLYDLDKRRVILSRSVVFREEENGFSRAIKGESNDGPNVKRNVQIFDLPILLDDMDNSTEDDDVPQENVRDDQVFRPTRTRRPPERFGEWASVALDCLEPRSVREALDRDDAGKWSDAMLEEIKSLEENKVWDIVDRPYGKNVIKTRWVFKLKKDENGQPERYRARLVAKGFTQTYGLDYEETFCPVVRFETIRVLLALAAKFNMSVEQMDIKTAFLNGDLKEEIYIERPEMNIGKDKEDKVCKLKKSLYGLKQSPRCWNSLLDDYLKSLGFIQIPEDPCLYQLQKNDIRLFLAVYVDDILLVCSDKTLIDKIKTSLSKRFQVKDLGPVRNFLGVSVQQDLKSGVIWVGQAHYVRELLDKHGMSECKPAETPTDPGLKLEKASDNTDPVDPTGYRSLIGGLLFLSVRTRPDLAFAVGNVAKFCSHPTKEHWIAAKKILRYLHGTSDFGIRFSRSCDGLVGFSDADWAGDIEDRRSTSGYVFHISGGPVSWKCQKQQSVALSTAEAEYMALSSASQEAIWLRKLLQNMGHVLKDATVIFEDNLPSIGLAKNPQFHGRAKHIDIRFHFTREQVQRGWIRLEYCKTDEMVADMLTKGLPKAKLIKLRSLCGVTRKDIE